MCNGELLLEAASVLLVRKLPLRHWLPFPTVAASQPMSNYEIFPTARSQTRVPADDDAAALSDYFNLNVDLAALAKYWSSQDPHYAFVNQHVFGCRMLRQDPVECLFQFICSSNNHISRIHGMVNHLCRAYGTKMELSSGERVPCQSCVAAPLGSESSNVSHAAA